MAARKAPRVLPEPVGERSRRVLAALDDGPAELLRPCRLLEVGGEPGAYGRVEARQGGVRVGRVHESILAQSGASRKRASRGDAEARRNAKKGRRAHAEARRRGEEGRGPRARGGAERVWRAGLMGQRKWRRGRLILSLGNIWGVAVEFKSGPRGVVNYWLVQVCKFSWLTFCQRLRSFCVWFP